MNDPLRKNSNSMVPIDHDDLRVAVRIDRVVRKSNFVSLSCGVNDKIVVQVEEKAASVFVVNFSTSIGFVLRNYFTAVFLLVELKIKRNFDFIAFLTYANEFIFLRSIFEENSPTGDIAWCHQQMLP